MEDVDDRPLTYAELKAIATGNPLIMEKAQVDSDVARISGQASRHEDTQHTLRSQAAQREELARNLRFYAVGAAKDEKALVSTRGDDFSIKIGDRGYGDRVEAANALAGALSRLTVTDQPVVIGKLGGLSIAAQKRPTSMTGIFTFDGYAKGENSYHTSLGDSADGNLQRMENLVASVAGESKRAVAEAGMLEEQAAKGRKSAADPFPDAAKLEQLLARQSEIDKELGIGQDDAQADAETEGDEAPPAGQRQPGYGPEGTPPPNARGALNRAEDLTAPLRWRERRSARKAFRSRNARRNAALSCSLNSFVGLLKSWRSNARLIGLSSMTSKRTA
jgi:hypothetical protein